MDPFRKSTLPQAPCALCDAANGRSADPWNRPIFESENFVVLPSLGSLVEGWLLIVPRQHVLSAALFAPVLQSEFILVRDHVERTLRARYGSACFFEHGPAAVQRSTGCGVDHAHVHALPEVVDLVREAGPLLPEGVTFMQGDLRDCRNANERNLDYLYVEQPMGSCWVAIAPAFASQTFRRAIASSLGMAQRFDWKRFPEAETIQLTQARLGSRSALIEATLV